MLASPFIVSQPATDDPYMLASLLSVPDEDFTPPSSAPGAPSPGNDGLSPNLQSKLDTCNPKISPGARRRKDALLDPM